MKSVRAGIPLRRMFFAVTDTVRLSHAGRLHASNEFSGWSTVSVNNTVDMLLRTSTQYHKIRAPPGGIPVALLTKGNQVILAVTGLVSSGLMTAVTLLGASGVSEYKNQAD